MASNEKLNSQMPSYRARQLYATGIISKKELDSILRSDARFRFEETVADAEFPSTAPPKPPLLPPSQTPLASSTAPRSPPPPSIKSRQALQAQRDAARRRGREEAARALVQAAREAQLSADRISWEKILADWGAASRNKSRIVPLCARGIPPAVRRRAWSAMIGNPLQITREFYEITARRARATVRQQIQQDERAEAARLQGIDGSEGGCGGDGDGRNSEFESPWAGKENSLRLLEQDLPRTFPELAFLHESGALREVLQTFVCFRPDIGYVQGMSYLAAALLLYMEDAHECFVAFANMHNNHFLFDCYRLQRDKIDVQLETFEFFFSSKLPTLFSHFKHCDITPDMYYLEWSLTLFIKFVPLNICARLWDNYLLTGQSYFVRAALGILRIYADSLRKMEMEDIVSFLQHLPQDMDETALFSAIDEILISPGSCERATRRVDEPGSSPGSGVPAALECNPS
mmetsp:Transcript_73546/g.148128  ORF Transcript_73546/g.148128 Transcript_73546/m.148128 type:complete len:461 (+) Transcript_73546:113-1495(+)|eukprot:CAMPEP_0171606354 /NCGR_PEP_ID=MMETSP0990-20121206/7718_1 /TAXON_ID=483369 /ORGANISM="non described non described, Strain CCMP2098" /LENGTH=460 /DNA_ID=CAMNT_0012169185 /DNA_START=121 /DNA_END=1503 /DNA_ORIENTATION=-